MRRIIGSTGAPQLIPKMPGGSLAPNAPLTPVVDLTSAVLQAAINGRTVFVDLWCYLADGSPNGNTGPGVPTYWINLFGPSQIGSTTGRKSWIFTAPNTNNFATAVADAANHRIAQELITASPSTAVTELRVTSDSCLTPAGPSHVLKRFPVIGPASIWMVHNYTTTPAPRGRMYVWGYYTIEGDDEPIVRDKLIRRPLQVSGQAQQSEYVSIETVLGTPVTVHTVSDTYIDEVTLDLLCYGADGFPNPPSDAVQSLIFQTPAVTMPIWEGGDQPISDTTGLRDVGFPNKRWLDGIPMRGAGNIQALRDANFPFGSQSFVSGSFVRY